MLFKTHLLHVKKLENLCETCDWESTDSTVSLKTVLVAVCDALLEIADGVIRNT